eukprot:3167724-Prymnesium_polylepis.1
MDDLLQRGYALAKGPGDQMAKLRSFGDALYDAWLKDEHKIAEFLRTCNSKQDVDWMLAIVKELCPRQDPTLQRSDG